MKNRPGQGGFTRDFIERVVEAVDLLKIFGRYTALKRSGRRYVGLCPFHTEKTPSFFVDPDRGLFYCFGCGKGGDVFDFIMEKEGLSFPEAVEYLAGEAGIPLPPRQKSSSETGRLQLAAEEALKFYQRMLQTPEGARGREYLKGRGISQSFLRQVGFGWAPDRWDALKSFVEQRGLDVEPFVKVGLLLKHSERGTLYDRFRGGVIIPIRQSSGRLVGFAMRSLAEGQPKYINSPDSPLYHKSEVLFGLDRARRAIRQQGFAVLVEGYFDAISLWQAGVENAVASCGTAFTSEHAAALARFTDTVVIFYDGDSSGLKASYRALEHLLRRELVVKIARPPEGMDPDDVARKWDAQQLKSLIGSAPDWLELSLEIAERAGMLTTVEGKLRFVDRMAPYIFALGGGMMSALYRRRLAEALGVGERELAARISRAARSTPQTPEQQQKSTSTPLPPEAQAELDLIAMTIVNPSLCDKVAAAGVVELYRGVFEAVKAEIESRGECSISALAGLMEPRAMSYVTKRLFSYEVVPVERDAEDVVAGLMRRRLQRERDELRSKLRQAEAEGNSKKASEILLKITQISQKINRLSGRGA